MEYEAKSEHTPKEQQRKYQGKGNCSEFCGAMLEIIPKVKQKCQQLYELRLPNEPGL